MFQSFLPEIFLSFFILIQLLYNTSVIKSANYPLIEKELYSQLFFLFVCLFCLYINLKIEGFLSSLLFLNDESIRCIKISIVTISLVSLPSFLESFTNQKLNFFEFFILLLLSLFSLFLVISSYDLISFYICIEMQSLCFYALASFKRDSAFSTEAGLKYFVAGSYISGFFLFGSSLIYLCLGALSLSSVSSLLFFSVNVDSFFFLLLLTGIFFVTFFLLFKIACAPFHFWVPDVYEGSPLSTTIIFSVIPKVGLFFFLVKWFLSLGLFQEYIQLLLLPLGLFSVFLGTFFAISQKRVKRLIIYSSVAQVGYIVSSLGLNTYGGLISVYFFFFIYIVTSVLLWFMVSLLNSSHNKISAYYFENVNSLLVSSISNFFTRNALWSFSFIVVFFSIAGIPPLSGFLSKIFIFLEFIRSCNLYFSIVFIVVGSVSVFYYIRVIKIIFFEYNFDVSSKDSFQSVFLTFLLDQMCFLLSIGLFTLMLIFFYPTSLLLVSEYIVCYTTIF